MTFPDTCIAVYEVCDALPYVITGEPDFKRIEIFINCLCQSSILGVTRFLVDSCPSVTLSATQIGFHCNTKRKGRVGMFLFSLQGTKLRNIINSPKELTSADPPCIRHCYEIMLIPVSVALFN